MFVLLITPMMVPVILVAIGAFYAYVKLKILYTMTGLVLAHSGAGAALGGDRRRLGAQELRHEPGDGGPQPGRPALDGPS